jgi:hypothetical protein
VRYVPLLALLAVLACDSERPMLVTEPTLSVIPFTPPSGENEEILEIRVTDQVALPPPDSGNMIVEWTSSDSTIVSVTQQGVVTGVAPGEAVIRAAMGRLAVDTPIRVLSPHGPPGEPELPRAYVDTRMPATPGRVIKVTAGGDLQAAIDSAERGDVIELAAGATFRGAFTLPPKSGSGWIVIRSSAHGQLPEGVRVRLTDATRMAQLVGGESNRRVLRSLPGASHWRIVGLEIGLANRAALPGVVNTVVEMLHGSSHIVLDRTWVHGTAGQSLQRCVVMNNAMSAVIESRLDRCHASGFDSQAIVGWHGPGPFKIVNNRLAGAGENIMFGGARIGDGDVPADIEIRRNHIFKPLAWEGVWTVKNALELKIAERVLFEGNVIENNWADAQVGFAINLKSENRDIATRPMLATQDVTIRNNLILNSRFGLTISATGSSAAVTGDGRTSRVLIENNIWHVEGRGFQLLGGEDVRIVNNTSPVRVLLEQPMPRLVFRGNLFEAPFKGSGVREGLATLERHAPDAIFTGNAVIGGNPALYPPHNYFPASTAQAPNGVGADASAVAEATRGVR